MQLICTNCRESVWKDKDSDFIKDGVKNGTVILLHGDAYAICNTCQQLEQGKPIKWSVETEAARYQRIVARIRKENPTLTIRQAVKRASVEFHDPNHEPNPAFRAYLIDR